MSNCPGCGHNYFDDLPVRNGYCKWCVEEGVWSQETKEAAERRVAEEWARRKRAEEARYQKYLDENDGDSWGYVSEDPYASI